MIYTLKCHNRHNRSEFPQPWKKMYKQYNNNHRTAYNAELQDNYSIRALLGAVGVPFQDASGLVWSFSSRIHKKEYACLCNQKRQSIEGAHRSHGFYSRECLSRGIYKQFFYGTGCPLPCLNLSAMKVGPVGPALTLYFPSICWMTSFESPSTTNLWYSRGIEKRYNE